MLEIRIHGKREQGVLLAAELLSAAACLGGMFGRTFSLQGPEEIGTPVTAWARITEKKIPAGPPVARPDALMVLEHVLLYRDILCSDLSPSGFMLINASYSLKELDLEGTLSRWPDDAVHLLPATDIAVRHLGRPLPAAAMVAGMAAIMGFPGLESVLAAIRKRFWGSISECNEAVAQEAYSYVRSRLKAGRFVGDFAHAD